MLNYQKLALCIQEVSSELFEEFDHEVAQARDVWVQTAAYQGLADKIRSRKWGVLVPFWSGSIAECRTVPIIQQPYQVLAIDGSQIYYDRHQAPSCYLLNIGSVFFAYEVTKSFVHLNSEPSIVVNTHSNNGNDTELVNVAREILEFEQMLAQALEWVKKYGTQSMLCLFDGSLLFMQKEQLLDQQKVLFARYIKVLETLMNHNILYAGYVSFPGSKELLNVVKLVAVDFDEQAAQNYALLHRLTDRDIASLFLLPMHRSIVFEMKNFLSYLYPDALKPYFLYLHVGFEIVRIEVPAWIARDAHHVDAVCAMVLDQVNKGFGYPVCLFEAHQQAVIKNHDRLLFYQMMQKMSMKKNRWYQVSLKSLKKMSMPV
ncbi:DNA double-strand break repair nuclease NurA [Candidatus Babeliales bacterium]|nr:DNA double-strand break repair nuclease NurA [Candidatus Babeliales bacterium]